MKIKNYLVKLAANGRIMKAVDYIVKLAASRAAVLPSVAFTFLNLFVVNNAYAQSINSITNAADINSKILCPIASIMFNVLITLSVIMVLYAAYMYVTGGDNAEKIKTAHKTIAYAAVGVIVALIARVFPLIIARLFDVGVSSCPSS